MYTDHQQKHRRESHIGPNIRAAAIMKAIDPRHVETMVATACALASDMRYQVLEQYETAADHEKERMEAVLNHKYAGATEQYEPKEKDRHAPLAERAKTYGQRRIDYVRATCTEREFTTEETQFVLNALYASRPGQEIQQQTTQSRN